MFVILCRPYLKVLHDLFVDLRLINVIIWLCVPNAAYLFFHITEDDLIEIEIDFILFIKYMH